MDFPFSYVGAGSSALPSTSYWDPAPGTNFSIAGSPAGAFADGGAAFANFLPAGSAALPSSVGLGAFSPVQNQAFVDSNVSPFSFFGNAGNAFGNIGGAGTDPYAGVNPDTRAWLNFFERQQDKNSNWREQADYWFQKEKERALDAEKMKQRLSIPGIITQATGNLANAIMGGAQLRAQIAADARRTIGDIQQQGIAYQPSSQRFFR